ncbi:MAG: FG-GAP repeat domain-containing protein, partial [Bacteroidales bacterium]
MDYDNDGDDDMFWEYDQTIFYECNCRPCDPGGGGLMQILYIPPPPQDTCCDICSYDKQLFKFYREQNGALYNHYYYDIDYYTSDNYQLYPGDYDGDGRSELMVLNSSNSVVDFERISVSPYPSFGTFNQMYFLDINGNGKTDIMTRTGSSIDVWEYNSDDSEFEMIIQDYSIGNYNQIYPGDFNGDGKTDLLTRYDNLTDSTRTRILYSQGDEFISKQGPISEYIKTGPPHGGLPVTYIDEMNLDFIALDFNGDGKTDILKSKNYLEVYKDEEANEFYTYYTEDEILVSTGLKFTREEIFFGEEGKRFFKAIDNNFDGNNDLLITLNNFGDKVLEFFPHNRRTNVLSITNGMNIKQEIQYE